MMSLTTRMPIEVLPAVSGVRRATQRIMGEEQPGGGGGGRGGTAPVPSSSSSVQG